MIELAREIPKTVYLKDYRAPDFQIEKLDLVFALHEEVTIVTSRLAVRRQSAAKHMQLNGEELQLQSIKVNDIPLADSQYNIRENILTVNDVPDYFTLETVVHIYPDKNTALSGLYRPAKTYCTQCEAEGFRRITYFPDRPDVLTKYTVTISADKKQYPYLLSNGNPIATGEAENGRHWVTWQDPFNKPCYLFALVAGDFDLLEDVFVTISGREVALRIYVEKGYGDQSQHAMFAVKQAMRWDEEAYGREYDLAIYMIVAIGDFNMGAMENKGLNIFNTKYILAKPQTATDEDYIHIASVIAHEYFHNWTGNRVTCRDWFQLSLKEGLTIFRDQSYSQDTLSHAVMRIRDVVSLREAQFPEDAGPLAHPVRPDSYIEINNFYTSTIYNKGAEVLRMLQTIIGKDMFRKAMDLYFERFDGQAVTIDDYVQVMAEVSGVDLKQFKRWYVQAGTPVLTVTSDYDDSKKIYTLTMQQQTQPTPQQPDKLPLHIPVRMALLDQQGNTLLAENVLHLKEAKQVFTFDKMASRPVPSLLRDFSAPVKLQYPYSDEELLFLSKHDTDAFNRWEAGQLYVLRVLLSLVADYQQQKKMTVPAALMEMYAYLLQQDHQDLLLLAEMLSLPTEKYIGEQMPVVDVEAIHTAREFLLTEIARQQENLLLKMYHAHHDKSGVYHYSLQDIGKRQVKNGCLSCLLRLPQHAALGQQQFALSLSCNMTDTLAALAALGNCNLAMQQTALDQFYQTFKNDALVIDKWLAIQALSKQPDALQKVKALMQHEAFDIKNPNKVYALIGTFGQRNHVYFHAKDGAGYRFLREVVQQLDKINPHVSARMVKPLTGWHRYDKERQALMRDELSQLLQDKNLSADLFELITKSL